MKRYVVFLAIGPFLGGFLLLVASTVLSGYWTETNPSELVKLVTVFFKSLPYNYVFGFVPVMAFAAVDDIISHIKRVSPVARMLIVGVLSFLASAWLYGFQAGEFTKTSFVLFGLGGLIPAMLSSWIAHRLIDVKSAHAA